MSDAAQRQLANLEVVRQLAEHVPEDIESVEHLFGDGFAWVYLESTKAGSQSFHYGVAGLRALFELLAEITDGTWGVETLELKAVGDELVVAHAKPSMEIGGRPIETESVVVWRILDGQAVAAWDVPGRRDLFS